MTKQTVSEQFHKKEQNYIANSEAICLLTHLCWRDPMLQLLSLHLYSAKIKRTHFIIPNVFFNNVLTQTYLI